MALGGGADLYRAWSVLDADGLTVAATGWCGCVQGGKGDDKLLGAAEDDTFHGGPGNDLLRGSGGADRLWGGDGRDQLSGGAGDDWLFGGSGDDRLDGGTGRDRMTGGAGADIFVLRAERGGKDVIVDFRQGEDRIHLDTDLVWTETPPDGAGIWFDAAARQIRADRDGDGVVDWSCILQSSEMIQNLGPADFV